MRRAALGAVLLLSLPACHGGHRASVHAAAWPVGAVHAGMLLHDDGHRLWSYRLDGARRLLWMHSARFGRVAAASADGRELVYIGTIGSQSKLYLLSRDGRVRMIDSAVHGWLHDPVFLRPAPGTKPRPYWSRSTERIRVLGAHGAVSVRVDLRKGEHPYRLAGYPGSPVFTLTLSRLVTPPQPALLMLLRPAAMPRLHELGELLPLRDVDNAHGVAWLSPSSFILIAGSKVRLVDYGCAYRGSKVVYSGGGIDDNLVDEGAWPLVPAGPQRVLVMPELPPSNRRDEGAVMRANERPLRWAVLDLKTRRLTRSPLPFSERGWVFVQPDRPFREGERPYGCTGFTQPPS
jgi:hypothetical protein